MPYVNHVYKNLVFQMIGVNGDAGLQAAVKKAEADQPAGEKRHTLTLNMPHQRVLELYLTKREVWYFDQDAWNCTKLVNPVVDFYSQYELYSSSDHILDEVAKASKIKYRGDVKLARITVHTFSEATPDTTSIEVSIAHYA